MTEPIVLGHLLGGRVDLPPQGRELTREEPVGVQERCPPDRGRRVVDEKVDSKKWKVNQHSETLQNQQQRVAPTSHDRRRLLFRVVWEERAVGSRRRKGRKPLPVILCCEGSGHRLSSGPPRSPRLLLALPVACRRPACPLCLPAAAAPCRLRGLNGQRARWLASMPRGLWVAPDETVI